MIVPRPLFFSKMTRFFITLLPLLLFAAACNNPPDKEPGKEKKLITKSSKDLFSKDEFEKTLAAGLPAVDTLDSNFKKSRVVLPNALRYTYQQSGYKPIWVEEGGVTAAAASFINDLDSIQLDGFDPERYDYSMLVSYLGKLKSGNASLQEVITFDTTCTHSYLLASHHLLFGRIAPKDADNQWFHTNDVVWTAPSNLYSALNLEAKYIPLDSYRPQLGTYTMLRNEYARYLGLSKDQQLLGAKEEIDFASQPSDSLVQFVIHRELPWMVALPDDSLSKDAQFVRAFQQRSGLVATANTDSTTIRALKTSPDSVKAKIAANMERIRWMPQKLEPQYVLVNVPLMELFYKKDGTNAFNMRVVVGKPARATPSLNADMANVVFSPPWGVPPTILKNDVLPGIAKRGGSYLARKGLKAYDRRGKLVNAGSVNAKNYRNFFYRQPPGARNALGEVKFNLPNKWDIYLHDTPHREDFVKRNRARSSGCVRVAQPRAFAEFILREIEGRNFDQPRIDSIIQTRRTIFEQLATKIPVHIVYLTAYEDSTNSHINLLGDIYKRDAKLIAALAK